MPPIQGQGSKGAVSRTVISCHVVIIYTEPQPTGNRIDDSLQPFCLIQSIVYFGIIYCVHCWLISTINMTIKAQDAQYVLGDAVLNGRIS